MATPDGYKIYWGLSADDINGVHPKNPAYNSPFTIIGNIGNFALPADFWVWDNNGNKTLGDFFEVHFRVAAYKGAEEGVKSNADAIYTYIKTPPTTGLWGYSLPLNDGATHNAQDVAQTIDASVVFVYDKTAGKFKNQFKNGINMGLSVNHQTGMFANFTTAAPRVWRGKVWKS